AIANNESEDIENLYFKVPSILVTPQLFVLSRGFEINFLKRKITIPYFAKLRLNLLCS
ncbi:hypothetical protein SAMN05216556_1071, partial [Aequorivita viscosa]